MLEKILQCDLDLELDIDDLIDSFTKMKQEYPDMTLSLCKEYDEGRVTYNLVGRRPFTVKELEEQAQAKQLYEENCKESRYKLFLKLQKEFAV